MDGSQWVLCDSLQACAQLSGCRICPNSKSSWVQMQGRSGHVSPASSHHYQHPQCNSLPLYHIIKELWCRFPRSFKGTWHNSFFKSDFQVMKALPNAHWIAYGPARLFLQEKSIRGTLSLWITQWFRGVHGIKGAAKKGPAAGHCLDLMLPFIKGSWEEKDRSSFLTAKGPPPILQQMQQEQIETRELKGLAKDWQVYKLF